MKYFFCFLLVLSEFIVPATIWARESNRSAMLVDERLMSYDPADTRIVALTAYLELHHSPFSMHAHEFIRAADYYDIDWRLVPAISGVESTFGKHIPQESYNAYGWDNGLYRFSSWEDSIWHVTSVLKEKYIARGLDTPAKIGRVYAPPSDTWGRNVTFFIDKINDQWEKVNNKVVFDL